MSEFAAQPTRVARFVAARLGGPLARGVARGGTGGGPNSQRRVVAVVGDLRGCAGDLRGGALVSETSGRQRPDIVAARLLSRGSEMPFLSYRMRGARGFPSRRAARITARLIGTSWRRSRVSVAICSPVSLGSEHT